MAPGRDARPFSQLSILGFAKRARDQDAGDADPPPIRRAVATGVRVEAGAAVPSGAGEVIAVALDHGADEVRVYADGAVEASRDRAQPAAPAAPQSATRDAGAQTSICEECDDDAPQASSSQSATPPHLVLPDLPPLPKKVKDRVEGKYISNGNVVYFRPGARQVERVCWNGDCTTQPSFGLEGDTRRLRCAKCKTPQMVDIANKRCKCGKHQPSFGLADDPSPTRCAECKTSKMIDITNKRCKCGKHVPSFGLEGDPRPTRCAECKTSKMINMRIKMCECGKHIPSFGLEGDPRPTRCAECKTSKMINIVSKTCECGKHRPSFGLADDPLPTRCAECKTSKMIDIVHGRCECGKHIPSFGLTDDPLPTRCAECKTSQMVDIANKRCKCGERARYNDSDDNKCALCLNCAVAEGTHPERVQGASYAACRFFCALRAETQGRESVPHVHWDRVTGEWNGYNEVESLVPGRRLRPDGFLEDESGETKGVVYLFHGNRFHGYPPGHPAFDSVFKFSSARSSVTRDVRASDLYAKTAADTAAYLAAGYKVVTVWGHEFKDYERRQRSLRSAMHVEMP